MSSPVITPPEKTIRIGRSPDSDIVLDFPIVSWEHARLMLVGGEYILEDLNSTNGTSVNHLQNRITRSAGKLDDNIYFGSVKIPAGRLLEKQGTVIGLAAYA